MAIVLEGCTTEEQRSAVRFLCGKGLNAKEINKDFSCLRWEVSRKVVHYWVAYVSLMTKKLKRW
jgi:hypothetical protein